MGLSSASVLGGEADAIELAQWFAGETGRHLAESERLTLAQTLPNLFGYHLLQLGVHHPQDLCVGSRISHKIKVALSAAEDRGATMRCCEDALPVASGSIDVLLLPHVLEFADDPRRVLREAERVLIGEGHIVVAGFSPWSWFGLLAALKRWQRRAPWNARMLTLARVKDWLQLLGFDIVEVARLGYRPLTKSPRVNQRLMFLETLGAFCWPPFANAYVLLAKKRVEGVTPLKASWRQRRRVLAGSVAEPSARVPPVERRGQRGES